MQTGTTTLEYRMEFPQNDKNRTTLFSNNCTTRYLPKEYKNTNSKGYMHPDVYSSIINSSQTMEIAQASIEGWMDKEDVVYIMEYYSATKKNKILPFATTWIELQSMMLSEMSVRERQISYDFTRVKFKKQNKWTKGKRERDKPRNRLLTIENKVMVTEGS